MFVPRSLRVKRAGEPKPSSTQRRWPGARVPVANTPQLRAGAVTSSRGEAAGDSLRASANDASQVAEVRSAGTGSCMRDGAVAAAAGTPASTGTVGAVASGGGRTVTPTAGTCTVASDQPCAPIGDADDDDEPVVERACDQRAAAAGEPVCVVSHELMAAVVQVTCMTVRHVVLSARPIRLARSVGALVRTSATKLRLTFAASNASTPT